MQQSPLDFSRPAITKQDVLSTVDRLQVAPTSTIAREMGVSIPQISMCLKRLEKQGVLASQVMRRPDGVRGRPTVRVYERAAAN